LALALWASLMLAGSIASSLFADPELRQYRLNVATLERVIQATRAMRAASSRDARLRKEAETQQPPTASLRSNIEGIARTRPLHVELIKANGLTVDDYFLTCFAIFQAQLVDAHGADWMAIRKFTNPDNLAFLHQHAREVDRFTYEVAGLDLKEQKIESR
jgi:hypothetical protein